MDKSFKNQLLNINENWKSHSRIFGQAIEQWVEDNVVCEAIDSNKYCRGKLFNQPANQKSYDVVCENCDKKYQIKATKTIIKANRNNQYKVLGSEYQTTLNSINSGDNWDIILIHYDIEMTRIQDVFLIYSKFITSDIVLPRKPLGPNARRAGWQGCYLVFDWDKIRKLY